MAGGDYRAVPEPSLRLSDVGIGALNGAAGVLSMRSASISVREVSRTAGGSPVIIRQR